MRKTVDLGIDLGTSNTVVAYIDDQGKPQVIRNVEGDFLTPSVVVFPEEDGAIVGRDAKNALMLYPGRSIVDAKRLMGERTEGGQSITCVCIDGKEYSPESGAAMIIRKVIADAKAFLGEDATIRNVVVTVPAYFKDGARKDVKVAGQIAGVDIKRLVNEPTAAALNYLREVEGEKTVLVYDVGGGTTDVSIINCSGKRFEVLATKGNQHLGGTDLDGLLMEYCLEDEFQPQCGFRPDPVEDTAEMQDFKDRIQRAREALSNPNLKKTKISLSFRGKQMTVEITRSKLEELIGPLVEETMDIVEQAVQDAGLSMDKVDDIILVGGTTRTPLIRNRFKERFNREPVTARVEPDLAVAMGAALVAGAVDIEEGTYALEGTLSREVLDVTAHPLGVEAVDGKGKRTISVIIPANTHIPVEAEKIYSLESDLQTKVHIKVCQGPEGALTDSEDCEVIGKLALEKLPRQKIRKPRIQVTFKYNSDGIIEAEATDTESGKSTNGRIEGQSGLSPDEIDQAKDDIEGTLLASEED